jgi:hypothetical protein
MDPYSKVDYSHITPEATMVMKKASAGIPLSGRVSGRASGPSQSRVDDGGGLQYVSWKIDWSLGVFLPRGLYRRKGGVRR